MRCPTWRNWGIFFSRILPLEGFLLIRDIGSMSMNLMKEKEQEVSEIKDLMIEKTDRMEKVLKQVVKVLGSRIRIMPR